nr:hypothetical protein [uncultured bacterium]
MASASARTVGYRNMSTSESPPSRCSSSRALATTTSSEFPPRSKKLSSTPTRSTPSTSCHTSATIRSVAFVGGAYARVFSGRAPDGSGSALRSTFPLGVNGTVSMTWKAPGTI